MKDATIDKIGHHVVVGLTSVTGLVIGSFVSKAGTVIGTGVGSICSSVTGELYLSLFGRGRSKFARLPKRLQRGLAGTLVGLVAIPLGVTGVEAATNKPLHAVVTGQSVHGGTSFLGGTTKPGPQPSATTPAPTPSSFVSPGPSASRSTLATTPAAPESTPAPSQTTGPATSPTPAQAPTATAPATNPVPVPPAR